MASLVAVVALGTLLIHCRRSFFDSYSIITSPSSGLMVTAPSAAAPLISGMVALYRYGYDDRVISATFKLVFSLEFSFSVSILDAFSQYLQSYKIFGFFYPYQFVFDII